MIELGQLNFQANEVFDFATKFMAHNAETLDIGKQKLKEVEEIEGQLTAEDFGSANVPLVQRIQNRLQIARNFLLKTTDAYEAKVEGEAARVRTLEKARKENKERLAERTKAIQSEREERRVKTEAQAAIESEAQKVVVEEEKKRRGRPKKNG